MGAHHPILLAAEAVDTAATAAVGEDIPTQTIMAMQAAEAAVMAATADHVFMPMISIQQAAAEAVAMAVTGVMRVWLAAVAVVMG